MRIPDGVVRARPIRVVSDHDAFLLLVSHEFQAADLTVPAHETVPGEDMEPSYRARFRVADDGVSDWDALAGALRTAVWRAA